VQATVKMATAEKRFHVPSEEETDKDSINTQKATQLSVKCFRDYLREQDPDNVEYEEFSLEHFQLNFQGKVFFTQNWCNIIHLLHAGEGNMKMYSPKSMCMFIVLAIIVETD
jgi:hypothetical protein